MVNKNIEQLSLFDDDKLDINNKYVLTMNEFNSSADIFDKIKLTYIFILSDSPKEYWFSRYELARIGNLHVMHNNIVYAFSTEEQANQFYIKCKDKLINIYKENSKIVNENNAKKGDRVYINWENSFKINENLYRTMDDKKIFAPIWSSYVIPYHCNYHPSFDKMSHDEKIQFCIDSSQELLHTIMLYDCYNPAPIFYISLKDFKNIINTLIDLGYDEIENLTKEYSIEVVNYILEEHESSSLEDEKDLEME
jgi:hypothetical protein